MNKGMVFDIKRFAVHDGPGIRSTVFLKGCPLSCVWCQNPEGMRREADIAFFRSRCIACGICGEVCPEGAQQSSAETKIDRARCVVCGRCAEACPAGALVKIGEEMTVDEILDEVLRDRHFYEGSGGGVTISGGEPLHQPQFASALLKALKESGIHTALDTCGYAEWKVLDGLLPHCDLVLYDLKMMDRHSHLKYTAVDNTFVLNNLSILAGRSVPLIVRIPIIPGFNDTEEEIRSIADVLSSLGIENVELLPFNTLAASKYAQLGRPCPVRDIRPLDRRENERLRRVLTNEPGL